jgi:hypothetical protein
MIRRVIAYGTAAALVGSFTGWLVAVTFPGWVIVCAINQGMCWN